MNLIDNTELYNDMHGTYGKFLNNGDKAQCHICGEWFTSVGCHTNQAHGIPANEYREIFGLSCTQGLESCLYLKKRAEKAKKEYDLGLHTGLVPFSTSPQKISDKVRGHPRRLQTLENLLLAHQPTYINTICKVCGKEFTQTLTKPKKTCSSECRLKALSLASGSFTSKIRSSNQLKLLWNDLNKNPEKKENYMKKRILASRNWVTKICPFCNNSYEIGINNKQKTCGKIECVHLMRSKNSSSFIRSPEYKQKMSIIATERHKREDWGFVKGQYRVSK